MPDPARGGQSDDWITVLRADLTRVVAERDQLREAALEMLIALHDVADVPASVHLAEARLEGVVAGV